MELGIIFSLASPFTVAFLLPMLLWYVLKNRLAIYATPINYCLLGLAIWSALSGINNRSWYSLFGSAFFGFYLLLSIYFQNHFQEQASVEVFLRKLHKFALIPAIFGITEKFVSFFVDMTWMSHVFWSPTYIPSAELYRIYSTFGNPNVAGDWFAMLGLLSIYFLEQSPYKKKTFYLLSTGLYVLALLFTGSKGSLIGLIAGMMVFAVFSEKKKTKWVIGTLIAGIVLAACFIPELNRPSNYRNIIWLKSLLLYKNHSLMGVGLFGVFERTGEIHSHNIWISLLAMLGIGGFALYLGVKLYLYNGLLKLRQMRNTLMPLLAALQALIVGHGLVDFTIMTPQGGLLFIGAAGLITAMVLPFEQPKALILELPKLPVIREFNRVYERYQQTNAKEKNI